MRHGLGIAILLLGMGYALCTAPFGVPDEFAHFWRAYHVSEGGIVAQESNGRLRGAMLPKSVDEVVETLVHYRSVPIPSTHIDRAGWRRAWRMGFHPNERAYCSFPATASYSPVVYAPAALAIALGRACNLSILAVFYLARIANVIAVATLIGLAWRRLPCIRESFALVTLLPMTLSLIGSLSADSITFAIAFFWIALVLDFASAEKPNGLTGRNLLEIFVAAALLGQTKFFFPLPLLALLWVFRFGRSRALVAASAVGVAFLSAALWFGASGSLDAPGRLDLVAGPALQSVFIRAHPWQFLEICAHTFQMSFVTYGRQIVGVLGWLQIRLPVCLYVGMWIALLFSTGFAGAGRDVRVKITSRIFCATLALAMLLYVYLALYGKWNTIGAPVIEGVHGRYLILMLPLLAIAGRSTLWSQLGIARAVRISLYAFALVANGCALFIQFRHAFG